MDQPMANGESNGPPTKALLPQSSFGRDFTASVHLYLTHWMWMRVLGFHLHPSVPAKGDLAVACVNDSTGIWSIELGRQNPNFRCDSFDISGEQFPQSAWLPKNVTLSVLDFTKPIPVELRGQYDVVRCPWLSLHSRKGNFMKIVDNLLMFLKPGGYFQWEEADMPSSHVVPANPSLSTADTERLLNKMVETLQYAIGSDMRWISDLESHARSRNLIVLANGRHKVPDDIAHPWTLQHLMAAMGLIQSFGDDTEMINEWLEVYDRAAIGVAHGVSMRMDLVSCLSQVPPGRVTRPEAVTGI